MQIPGGKKTRNLVDHHWREIEDLAKALLERKTLNGEEVKESWASERLNAWSVILASAEAQALECRLGAEALWLT